MGYFYIEVFNCNYKLVNFFLFKRISRDLLKQFETTSIIYKIETLSQCPILRESVSLKAVPIIQQVEAIENRKSIWKTTNLSDSKR